MTEPAEPGASPEPANLPGPAGTSGPSALPVPRPVPGSLDRAVEFVHFLRAHCPWDGAQTPESLTAYLSEEANEVIEAIRDGDPARIEGELGDLLLNVAFQIAIGEEQGRFDRESVTVAMEEKMRRRHPHLFGLGPKEPWEVLKARERGTGGGTAGGGMREGGPQEEEGRTGIFEGLPAGLDPLTLAQRIQERVSGVGFDWAEPRGAWEKVAEEVREVGEALGPDPTPDPGGATDPALEEELGDLLFSVVNLARLTRIPAGGALHRANAKFRRRFEALERLARERSVPIPGASLEEMDRLWEEVKAEEGRGTA